MRAAGGAGVAIGGRGGRSAGWRPGGLAGELAPGCGGGVGGVFVGGVHHVDHFPADLLAAQGLGYFQGVAGLGACCLDLLVWVRVQEHAPVLIDPIQVLCTVAGWHWFSAIEFEGHGNRNIGFPFDFLSGRAHSFCVLWSRVGAHL